MYFDEPTINVVAVISPDGKMTKYTLDRYHDKELNAACVSGLNTDMHNLRFYLKKYVPKGFTVVSLVDESNLSLLAEDQGCELKKFEDGRVTIDNGNFNYFRKLTVSEINSLKDIVDIK